jgi:excisionase family DNA binding protein
MLRVNPETIRRAARRGELQSIRVGLKHRYSESAVGAWLELLASPSPERPAA